MGRKNLRSYSLKQRRVFDNESAFFNSFRGGHTYRFNYQGNYLDHLLEQYKIFVQMADNVSERRSKMNKVVCVV